MRDVDKGKDGSGGKHGKNSGDVGFVNLVNWRKPGGLRKYCGFGTDVRLDICDGKSRVLMTNHQCDYFNLTGLNVGSI